MNDKTSIFYVSLSSILYMCLFMLFDFSLNAFLHYISCSCDVIKNSFAKCDKELMAFSLMNHRM